MLRPVTVARTMPSAAEVMTKPVIVPDTTPPNGLNTRLPLAESSVISVALPSVRVGSSATNWLGLLSIGLTTPSRRKSTSFSSLPVGDGEVTVTTIAMALTDPSFEHSGKASMPRVAFRAATCARQSMAPRGIEAALPRVITQKTEEKRQPTAASGQCNLEIFLWHRTKRQVEPHDDDSPRTSAKI